MPEDIFETIRASLSRPGKQVQNDGAMNGAHVSNQTFVDAAVLIILLRRPSGINILLTKRAANLSHHAGQIAFPGGRAAAKDSGMIATAVREAKEEIGLKSDEVRILGSCPCHWTSTGFRIFPFVSAVNDDFQPTLQIEEVESVFEVPLSYLTDFKNYQQDVFEWQGEVRDSWAIHYKSHHIWGVTAAILHELAHRLNNLQSKTVGLKTRTQKQREL